MKYLLIVNEYDCLAEDCKATHERALFGGADDSGWERRSGHWLCPRHAELDARLMGWRRYYLVWLLVYLCAYGVFLLGASYLVTLAGYERFPLDGWPVGLLACAVGYLVAGRSTRRMWTYVLVQSQKALREAADRTPAE